MNAIHNMISHHNCHMSNRLPRVLCHVCEMPSKMDGNAFEFPATKYRPYVFSISLKIALSNGTIIEIHQFMRSFLVGKRSVSQLNLKKWKILMGLMHLWIYLARSLYNCVCSISAFNWFVVYVNRTRFGRGGKMDLKKKKMNHTKNRKCKDVLHIMQIKANNEKWTTTTITKHPKQKINKLQKKLS